MFLVIVGRADMVDQVVANVLRAERTPPRLLRPDHQTFKAELVGALRDQCAVNDGLQADCTVVLVDLCIKLENMVVVSREVH